MGLENKENEWDVGGRENGRWKETSAQIYKPTYVMKWIGRPIQK